MGMSPGWRPAWLAVPILAGCTATYAPPLQSTHSGAPGRVAQGDVVVGGSILGAAEALPPLAGGPTIAYGVRDDLAVESGGNINLGEWGIGWAGLRYTHAPRRHAKNHLALDLHGAGGVGWGGLLRGNADEDEGGDGRRAGERVSGGGAVGAGIAGHFSFFAVYARARGQLTSATNVPATAWGDAGVGVQFRLARAVDLYAQTVSLGYRNRAEGFRWLVPLYSVGLAIRIPTARYAHRYR